MGPANNKSLISDYAQRPPVTDDTPKNAPNTQIVTRPHRALQAPAAPLHTPSNQSLNWSEIKTNSQNSDDWVLLNTDGSELPKTEIRQRKPEAQTEQSLDESILAPASLPDESEQDDRSVSLHQLSNVETPAAQTPAKEPMTRAPDLTQTRPTAKLATSSQQFLKLNSTSISNFMGSCFILSVAALSILNTPKNQPSTSKAVSGITFRYT